MAATVVAPLAGAWIETRLGSTLHGPSGRRPPRGGVDRNTCTSVIVIVIGPVAPLAGAWIETHRQGSSSSLGSKSPPSRGRGSKPRRRVQDGCDGRRPPRGGVDRNEARLNPAWAKRPSPPSRGRGSKHLHVGDRDRHRTCRPPRGGVDRNASAGQFKFAGIEVAPLAGAWIETARSSRGSSRAWVAPLAGAWIETSPAQRAPRS